MWKSSRDAGTDQSDTAAGGCTNCDSTKPCGECGGGISGNDPAALAFSWGELTAVGIQSKFWRASHLAQTLREAPARDDSASWIALDEIVSRTSDTVVLAHQGGNASDALLRRMQPGMGRGVVAFLPDLFGQEAPPPPAPPPVTPSPGGDQPTPTQGTSLVPPKCCCVAESITITIKDVTAEQPTTVEGKPAPTFKYAIDITIKFDWSWIAKPPSLGCKMEWWELTSLPTGPPCRDGDPRYKQWHWTEAGSCVMPGTSGDQSHQTGFEDANTKGDKDKNGAGGQADCKPGSYTVVDHVKIEASDFDLWQVFRLHGFCPASGKEAQTHLTGRSGKLTGTYPPLGVETQFAGKLAITWPPGEEPPKIPEGMKDGPRPRPPFFHSPGVPGHHLASRVDRKRQKEEKRR